MDKLGNHSYGAYKVSNYNQTAKNPSWNINRTTTITTNVTAPSIGTVIGMPKTCRSVGWRVGVVGGRGSCTSGCAVRE